MVHYDCLEKPLRRAFQHYGRFLSRHPLPFILTPIILAGILGTGFTFLEINTDVDYLYTIESSEVKMAIDNMKQYYEEGVNRRYVQITAVLRSSHVTSIWSEDIINELIKLDDTIKKVIIDDGSKKIRWEDVCELQNTQHLKNYKPNPCIKQPLFQILQHNASNIPFIQLRYPKHNTTLFLPTYIGGVTTTKSVITTVKAFRLIYPTQYNRTDSLGWERAARDTVLAIEDSFQHISLSVSSTSTLEDELAKVPNRAVAPFLITFLVLCTFAVMTCLSLNCVISKPWLGLGGIMCASFATISGFGLLLFFLPFSDLVTAVPFLSLGIGLDDMFVMIAAWRKSSSELSTEQRMGEALADAAVSITITTLTDALAIGVGAITNLPSVRLFCIFTAVCVLFDYIFMVTVFAGLMVYSGRREAKHIHACTSARATPKSEANDRSCCFTVCCTGGSSTKNPGSSEDRSEHTAMVFFRDAYGSFITSLPSKVIVTILYLLYLGGAIWGCLNIKEGLELTKIVADDSYANQDFRNWDLYFREYDSPVSLMVYDKMDYSDPKCQDKVEDLVKSFEGNQYFHGSEATQSWLRHFLQYIKANNIEYNMLNMSTALDTWCSEEPQFAHFRSDIIFSNDSRTIEATRYAIYPKDQATPKIRMLMQSAMMDIVEKSTDLNATAVCPSSLFYESWLAVLPNALQSFGIATAAVLLVCLLLIPNPVCSLYVALSIVSMCVGLVGYMSLWDVHIDSVSMVNIIMAVGFSVDFTAHITYGFTVASGETRRERVKSSLFGLGVPIVQGSLSTILAVVVLSTAFIYVLRVFFVTMFLTMTFGALHGLVFIPVLLSIIGPKCTVHKKQQEVKTSPPKPIAVVKPFDLRESKIIQNDESIRKNESQKKIIDKHRSNSRTLPPIPTLSKAIQGKRNNLLSKNPFQYNFSLYLPSTFIGDSVFPDNSVQDTAVVDHAMSGTGLVTLFPRFSNKFHASAHNLEGLSPCGYRVVSSNN